MLPIQPGSSALGALPTHDADIARAAEGEPHAPSADAPSAAGDAAHAAHAAPQGAALIGAAPHGGASAWDAFGPPVDFLRTVHPSGSGSPAPNGGVLNGGAVLYAAGGRGGNSGPAPARAAPSDARIAQWHKQRTEADADVTRIQGELKRIEGGLRVIADPDRRKHLMELKTRFQKELGQALGRRDAADKAIAGAYSTAAGTGPLREQVGRLHQRLEGLNGQIAQARKDETDATAQLTRDVDAAEAARRKHGLGHRVTEAAIAKATASSAKAESAAARVKELTAVVPALTGELQRRQMAAFAEAKKANDPLLARVLDFTDLASMNRTLQTRVLGAPVAGIDANQAAAADRNRIAGSHNPAQELATQLDGADFDQQLALINAAGKEIGALAVKANYDGATAVSMLDAIRNASGGARTELAQRVAASMESTNNELVRTLNFRMMNGDGFAETYALESGLRKAGKAQLANEVQALREKRLGEITSNFDEKNARATQLNTELARLMVGFGPMLDAGQRQNAIDAFKAQHKAEYSQWEAAGEKMARAAEFISEYRNLNARAALLVPDALATPAGEKAILEALERQSVGKPSLIDNMRELGKDSIKVATNLQTLVVKGIGMRALMLAKDDPQAAIRSIEAVSRNAGLFGLTPTAMDKVTRELQNILENKQGAVEALNREINALAAANNEVRGVKPNSSPYNALKGLGVVFAAYTGMGRLESKDLAQYMKGVGEVLGAGVDAGVLAMDVLGKSSKWINAAMFAKTGSAAFQAYGAVMDGIAAVSYFRKGDAAQGVASSMSAVGGAILATAAMGAAVGVQVVPVAGQIIGGILVVGGTVMKWVVEARREAKREAAMERDAEAFLKAAGFDPKIADKLSDVRRVDGRNVGIFIQQLAPALGMTPKALLDRLIAMGPAALEKFIDMSKDLIVGSDGKVIQAPLGNTDKPYIDRRTVLEDKGQSTVVRYYPQSMPSAIAWTRQFLGMPPR